MIKSSFIKIREKGILDNLSPSILYIFLIILSILLLLSLLGNIVHLGFLPIDLTNQGFITFFNLYSSSIKIAGALLAVVTLIITLERMKQTKDQIKLIGDNNKFNNYYKHREEFVKYFSDNDYIMYIKGEDELDKKRFINVLYELFYYPSYHEFSPVINNDAEKVINIFMTAVRNSELNKDNFDLLSAEGIKEIDNTITNSIFGYIYTTVNSKILRDLHRGRLTSKGYIELSDEKRILLEAIFRIHYLNTCISYVLNFQGNISNELDNFRHNFLLLTIRLSKI